MKAKVEGFAGAIHTAGKTVKHAAYAPPLG
jgi:hypothetical protein